MLKKSFSILNSILTIVFIAFLLDIAAAVPQIKNLGLLAILLLLPLKVMFYSGCYGSLVEIASGEKMFFQYKNFIKNIKNFWKAYTGLLILPSFLFCLISLFNILPGSISLSEIYAYFDIYILLFLIIIIIQKKYLNGHSGQKKKIVIPSAASFNIVFLYVLSIIVFHSPFLFMIRNFEAINLFLFLSRYMHFLMFIYLSTVILSNYPKIERSFDHEKELFQIFPVDGKIINSMSFPLLRVNPPVFTILKALTPGTYNIRKFNKLIWRDRYYRPNKLVAITCFTANCYEAYKIAKEFRSRGSTVIMGGPHISTIPDEALEYCDSVIVGEAENIWQEAVSDYENNCLKKKYINAGIDNYCEKTFQEFLNSPYEVIRDSFETTRGCKYRCEFCTTYYLAGRKIRKMPIEMVVALIKKVKAKSSDISFIDNNIFADPQYAKELFRALIPLRIKWSCQCSIDITKDEEALRLAKESGCKWLLFGYEIVTDSKEGEKGGKLSLAREYITLTRKAQNMGIVVKGQFLFGFDDDTLINLFKMWKFCLALHLEFSSLSLMTPYPGSKFYSDVLREDRLTNMNWRAYDIATLVFRHKKMNNTLIKILFQPLRVFILLTTSLKGLAILLLIIGTLTLAMHSF